MANGFLNAQTYSNALMLLVKNSLVWGRLVNGQFKNEVTDENGLITSVKAPPHFLAQDGPTLQAQRMLIGSRTVQVDQYKNVHLTIGDLEYVQSFNDLMKNAAMASAASALAHAIDAQIAAKALEFPSAVYTNYGANIKTTADVNKAHTQLMAQGVPNEQLKGVLTYGDSERIANQLVAYANDGINSRSALEEARVQSPMRSIAFYATQQVPFWSNGDHTMSAGPQVKGASQNVNYKDIKTAMTQTFILDGLGNSKTVKAGEQFQIADVYEYDWRQQKQLANLQTFTVITGGTTDVANGSITVTVAPPMIVPGTSDGTDTIANSAFATVNSAPADDAAITFLGAASTQYDVRTAFHKSAISLVSAKLQRPFTGECAFTTDKETGITIRYWRGSDISTGVHAHRWDCIFGVTNVDRRLGVRIFGTT